MSTVWTDVTGSKVIKHTYKAIYSNDVKLLNCNCDQAAPDVFDHKGTFCKMSNGSHLLQVCANGLINRQLRI